MNRNGHRGEGGPGLWLAEVALRLLVRDPEAREGFLGDLQEEGARQPAAAGSWLRPAWLRRLQVVHGYARSRRRLLVVPPPPPRPGDSKLSELLQDLKFSVRTLTKASGFTAAAVLTLAVGIGAATAMFGVLNTALLRALPYERPERLVVANTTFDGQVNSTSSSPDYDDLRAQSESFETLGVMSGFPFPVTVTGTEEPHRATLQWVSWDFFPMLGTTPALGRPFTPEDELDDGPDLVIVSHRYWQERLGGRADVVGSTLLLGGDAATVVGVMPPGFHFLFEIDLFYPYRPQGMFAGGRQYHNWVPVGRLRDGVALEQAQSEVDAIMANLAAEYPDTNEGKGMLVTPLHDALAQSYSVSLWVLMGAVALVLLIACANVANLQLVRGSARQAELSVRAALGAGRGRLVRQLLTESLLLALFAGALGVVLASWLQRAVFEAVTSSYLIAVAEIRVDTAMLAFAAVASLGTSVLFGVAPALRLVPGSLAQTMAGGQRVGDSRSGLRLRSALVVAQVAMCVTMLVGAGLLLRGYASLLGVQPGFVADHLLVVEVELLGTEYPPATRSETFGRMIASLRAVPGVTAVGAVSQLPILSPGNNIYVYDARKPPVTPSEMQTAYTRTAIPGYFDALQIPLLGGRVFSDQDTAEAPPVMVVNRAMATLLFPGEDPLGQRVVIDSDDPVDYTVVGVVGDVLVGGLSEEAAPTMYRVHTQRPEPRMGLAVRHAGDPRAVTPALREAIWGVDRNIPLEVRTMDSVIADSPALAQSRLFTSGLSLFAGVALLLAAVGLYGVLAYHVSLRGREIGVRMALGAQGGNVVSLVLRRGLSLAAVGMAIGLVAAFAGSRLLRQYLFGVGTADPVTFLAVAAFFGLVACMACVLPARRAIRVDPVSALRGD